MSSGISLGVIGLVCIFNGHGIFETATAIYVTGAMLALAISEKAK